MALPIVRTLSLILLLILTTSASRAGAALIAYGDRTTWLAAVGALSGSENFESFLVDTEFRTAPVALNMMSVSGSATPISGVDGNLIDVPPALFGGFADVNGTAFAAFHLDPGNTGRIDFDVPFSAWGGDFSQFENNGATRLSRIEVYDSADVLLGSVFPSAASGVEFYGFELTGGDLASYIIFDNPGSADDYFGLDEIGFVVAPEPSTALLLGLGLVALGATRRRRG